MHYSIPAFGIACVSLLSTASAQDDKTFQGCHLELPVVEITERYPPYADFCARQPALCELKGAPEIQHDASLMMELERVTHLINQQVEFVLDSEQ
jgi:predicted transglutaminase-like cysteine proteinase